MIQTPSISAESPRRDNGPLTSLELRSRITSQGQLILSLVEIDVGDPSDDEVIVRVEAAPLNPSDIGLLFGPADIGSAIAGGTVVRPTLTAPVPMAAMSQLTLRIDRSLPVGNEAAGVVIRAGANATYLLGKTVSMAGGGMYTQYRRIQQEDCMVLDEGITPVEGAGAYINPLTSPAMIETMKREGHRAIVHTAAASNLGRMLVRLSNADGIELVNVVRSAEQIRLLQNLGARHVIDSSSATFEMDLTEALAETGATLCFDALSGGPVSRQILSCMEEALSRASKEYSRIGSSVHKQIYFYGNLDPRPIEIPRVGMAWGVGGWVVFPFLREIGPHALRRLRRRVNAGLRTTFASQFKSEISLADALSPEIANEYFKRSTGGKFLINPAKGLQ